MAFVKRFWKLSFSSAETDESVAVSHAPSSPLALMKHDVFLSYRGEDTGNGFTSHLRTALCRKQIDVYHDQWEERGVEISRALLDAIEGSKLAVVIFSVNYADSSWCLDELVHILKRHEMFVLPVFYQVDPSDVRKQKGDFEDALNRIMQRNRARLPEWKHALTTAAAISGWHSANVGSEADLVEIIVGDIIKKLRGQSPAVDFRGLVGYPQRLNAVVSMMELDSPNVRIIGICGMGGIGKTTLANLVYHKISFKFDACCFLANVREKWEGGRRELDLQKELMSELFKGENVLMHSIFDKERMKKKKVLIVLDDVDDSRQLDFIAGSRDWYAPESRIILTSRDDQALDGSDAKFNVTELSTEEAIELFQLKAFKTNPLTDDQIKWSEKVVRNYLKTEFNPLAVISLASTLGGKSIHRWKDILEKLREYPDEDVHKVLKISYDGLKEEKKYIFLDIACFFNRESKEFAQRILDGCGFSANEGIKDLIHKSLLKIVDFDKLWMQHLIESMGRQIVRAESVTEPGKRSRLWHPQDLCHVFEHNSVTETVQGIYLDMRGINMVDVSPAVFPKMYNLRVLKFHNHFGKCTLQFSQGQLQWLPQKLRYLYWDGYPFISLPSQFTGQNLVELKMQFSKIETLWGVQVHNVDKLRVIDLSFSKQLKEIPNLSIAPNIETVCLIGCELVREVPQYFEVLEKLTSLNLEDCSSLEKVVALPRNIRDVNLARCVSLTQLPNNIPQLNSLKRFQLAGCSSFEYMSYPDILRFLRDLE